MIIKNCKIIYLDRIEKGDIRINDGKIVEIGTELQIDEQYFDGEGLYLAPGFIDIHIHGAMGTDVMDATYESLNNISKAIASKGTTAFLATTMTSSTEDIRSALKAIKESIEKGTEGAIIIGAHLEGPFLNEAMIGAQNPKYLQNPSIDIFTDMTAGYLDIVKEITLAPEIEGAAELVKYLVDNKIVASIGHTTASYEEVINAVECGASHSTHLFNAMKGIHHREAGTVGGILESDITTEIICDGIHLSYPIIRLVLKQKSTDRVILITDAMMACCMKNGEYQLGGQKVIVNGEAARLETGVLAGSVLTLDKAIRNVLQNTNYQLNDIIKMVTYNAAKHCGINDRKGIIKEGYDADIVIFDADINIKKVLIGGKEIKEN